jgi:hypothetical protein
LNISKVPDLCIIDFDFNKEITENEKSYIRNNIISKLDINKVGLIQTCHDEIHIYCDLGTLKFSSNRNIKIISTDDYDIDIFCAMNDNENWIVLPESKVQDKSHGKTLKYKNIGKSFDKLKQLNTCSEVMESLGIDIEIIISGKAEVKPFIVNRNDKYFDITTERAELLINGLKDLGIHNDSGNIPIVKEITL